jgi:DtxR family Mn-dependent transcriptional regulator
VSSQDKQKRHAHTPAGTDFLKETYLSSLEGRVALRTLAERLSVSPPAISRMSQRLVSKGYLRRDGACGLELTEAGQKIALRALRKQRVFEVFLVDSLGYKWSEVFGVAAGSSNHLDDELVERMWMKLGKPDRCPHGDPIPSRDGKMIFPSARRLCEVKDGASGTVGRIASHDSDLLGYLDSLNVRPGVALEVVAHAPFNGPLRVRVSNGRFKDEHVIGAQLAEHIWLEEKQ